MLAQSLEVEVVCHRVGTLPLCRGWNRVASFLGVFQRQAAQGDYPGLLSEAVIKHRLTATQEEGVYAILQRIALREGTPWRSRSRNLEVGTEAEALDEGCLLTCYLRLVQFTFFAHSRGFLPLQSLINRFVYCQSDGGLI